MKPKAMAAPRSPAASTARMKRCERSPLRHANRAALTKHQRFLRGLEADGYARAARLPELGLAIQRAAREHPAKRLDALTQIRDAVARLL